MKQRIALILLALAWVSIPAVTADAYGFCRSRPSDPRCWAPTPTATLTPRPATATPTRTAPPASGSPSGQQVPVGDLPGWRQIYVEDFTTDAALGQFDAIYRNSMTSYPQGWPQTFGYSNPARYDTPRTVSVSGGVLRMNLHGETTVGADGVSGYHWLSPALQPNVNGAVYNQTYGKYTVRFRSEPLPTFKTAWLLWPQSEVWPRDSEVDFPEGGLDGNICAFLHHQGATDGSDQDAYCTSVGYGQWATADIEWTPTAVTFTLNGVVIGRSTSRLPNTPMHWVLQTEGCWNGCPPAGASATLQVDWIVMYARN